MILYSGCRETLDSPFNILQTHARKLSQVTRSIETQGLSALFDISRISFEGGIQAVGGGNVSLYQWTFRSCSWE